MSQNHKKHVRALTEDPDELAVSYLVGIRNNYKIKAMSPRTTADSRAGLERKIEALDRAVLRLREAAERERVLRETAGERA